MRSLKLILLVLVLAQSGCFWKLWQKKPAPEEVRYDVYGTLETITQDRLEISTKKGNQTFVLGPASVKGSNFKGGEYVHVFYKKTSEGDVVTLVVKKIG